MRKVTCLCLFLLSFCRLSSASPDNVIRFHSADRAQILNMHNDLRRSIYNAANMRELTWNHAVAHAAAEWGTRCDYISRPDNMWGQNMDYFHGKEAQRSPINLFKDSFNGWVNETMHYDYRRFKHCGRKHVCSYVQLIAADVEEVGCAVVKCPRLQLRQPDAVQTDSKLLLCFYTPWVNIMGQEVFIPHDRCTACPKGTRCFNNLCSARFLAASETETKPLTNISQPSINIGVEGNRRVSRPDSISGQSRRRVGSTHQRGNGRRNENTVITSNSGTPGPTGGEPEVVYVPNNRVEPFPGRAERREVRRLGRYEKYLQRHRQKELVQRPETVLETSSLNNTAVDTGAGTKPDEGTKDDEVVKIRKKRQVNSNDPRYLRRLENQRYYREYLRREHQRRAEQRREEVRREEIRRRREEERRRRQEAERQSRAQALRRLQNEEYRQVQYNHQHNRRRLENGQYYRQHWRRRENQRRAEQRLRQLEEEGRPHRVIERQRRAQELLLLRNEGELTSSEQYFTISAHNMLRRENGSRELTWSSYLERWAKYVIRCDIEYPGPITCYTNFGKADQDQDIYTIVYNWGAEGSDVRRPIRHGCRTPYDRSRCNHNTIIRNPSLTQMGCAAKDCGPQRQLTCIYNSG